MWTTLNLAAIAQIVAGSVVGAALAIGVQRRRPTRFATAAITVLVCTTAGVVTMILLRWPHAPLLFALGLVGTAAPLTLALAPAPRVSTPSEALEYLRRSAAAIAIHMVLGIAFAVLGFVVSLLFLALAST